MSSGGDGNRDVDADADEEEDEEEDLEKLQAEIARMEEEAARITKETEELEKSKNNTTSSAVSGENGGEGKDKDIDGKAQALRDAKSVYVGQVDYSTTPVDLLSHFEACGTVERVTIVCDKYTGRPKGMFRKQNNTAQFCGILLSCLRRLLPFYIVFCCYLSGYAYLEFQVQ
jgi:RNA recognition motif-containing protein